MLQILKHMLLLIDKGKQQFYAQKICCTGPMPIHFIRRGNSKRFFQKRESSLYPLPDNNNNNNNNNNNTQTLHKKKQIQQKPQSKTKS